MTPPGDPRRIVADGYDRIAERYLDWTEREVDDQVRPRYLLLLLEQVPRGARVLDLGCGGGGPTTAQLAERFDLTGVDLSARQIALSRQRLPHATFIHADMTRIAFPPASFDAITSFYAFLHLPAGELPGLIERIATWLRPGGPLVATMAGGSHSSSVEPDFLGVPMYFSGYPVERQRLFLKRAGLDIISLQPEQILEDGRPVRFLWTVAKKPVGRLRGGVILIEDDRVALIERVRSDAAGERYYVFPGGGAEPGETPAQAAERETREELGLDVRVDHLLAIVRRREGRQFFFAATTSGGTFGTGHGLELTRDPAERGTYHPVWLPLQALRDHDVRPTALAPSSPPASLPTIPQPSKSTIPSGGVRPPENRVISSHPAGIPR